MNKKPVRTELYMSDEKDPAFSTMDDVVIRSPKQQAASNTNALGVNVEEKAVNNNDGYISFADEICDVEELEREEYTEQTQFLSQMDLRARNQSSTRMLVKES